MLGERTQQNTAETVELGAILVLLLVLLDATTAPAVYYCTPPEKQNAKQDRRHS